MGAVPAVAFQPSAAGGEALAYLPEWITGISLNGGRGFSGGGDASPVQHPQEEKLRAVRTATAPAARNRSTVIIVVCCGATCHGRVPPTTRQKTTKMRPGPPLAAPGALRKWILSYLPTETGGAVGGGGGGGACCCWEHAASARPATAARTATMLASFIFQCFCCCSSLSEDKRRVCPIMRFFNRYFAGDT